MEKEVSSRDGLVRLARLRQLPLSAGCNSPEREVRRLVVLGLERFGVLLLPEDDGYLTWPPPLRCGGSQAYPLSGV
jgi:hypothetical protein